MAWAGPKELAKKSLTVHATYKLIRDFRTLPLARIGRPREISAVFRVLPNTMLPMVRLFDAFDAVTALNKEGVEGDIVECGVWNGGCVGLMALADKNTPGPRRKIHLFDSFEGLPQPSTHDIEVVDAFRAKHPELSGTVEEQDKLFATGKCVGEAQPKVERFLTRRLGIDREQLIFHVGWFQDTVPLARKAIGKIALLRLDGDWYESTKTCLEGLYDLVEPRGYVIMDDYGQFSGCRKAVDEFFSGRGIKVDFVYSDGQCAYFRKP